MTESVRHTLRPPESEDDWRRYHAIRRTVLFEHRGVFGVYDEQHPDERLPTSHPMVLVHDGEPIGTIRVDVEGKRAIFRRVAIREDRQRRGHGAVMLALAERFVRESGCDAIASFVNPDAVGFYERCGFARDDSLPADVDHVPMSKRLA